MEENHIFETLFQSATEGIMLVDEAGSIIMANPAAQQMFGYQRDMKGLLVEDLLPNEIRKRHQKHRNDYQKSPQNRSMGQGLDLYGKRLDGTTFPLEVSLTPTTIDQEPTVIAFIVDITERKTREHAMLSLGRIFDDTLNELYVFHHESLKFIRVNKAASMNLGYSNSELLEMDPIDIKPLFNKQEFLKLVDPLRNGIPKIRFETLHQRKDGSTYPVEVHLQLTEFDNQPSFMAVILDITERKQAENQLRKYSQDLERSVEERTQELWESQKLYQAISENFPDGTINVFDRDLNYVFVNGRELKTQNLDSSKLLGTSYLDKYQEPLSSQIKEQLQRVFNGEKISMEVEYAHQYYNLDAVPLLDTRGQIKQILATEKNITEQKQAQDDIRKNLEKERELNELKSRFVSMASHEFRTPLSTILTSASLLSKYQEDQHKERRPKHIERIKTSVHNLTAILNDFLSLDKLETGAIESKPVCIDLSTVVKEAYDQVLPTLKKDQELLIDCGNLGEVVLDKQLLHNVLINLINNASKYSGEGDLITVKCHSTPDLLKVSVTDVGIGISAEDQVHLFQRFFRASNATNIQGTGLGLNIVKKYVELMGGTVEFESELGQGSTFRISIPLN